MNDAGDDASRIQVLNFVQGVCKRPCMYTEGGTLREVVAFLCGFDCGYEFASRYEAERHLLKRVPADILASKTLGWLRSEFRPPARIVEGLLDRYQTEEAALEAIFKYASTLETDSSGSGTDEAREP